MAIVIGTDGNDRYNDPSYPGNVELKGTNGADQIYGLAGADELVGFDGDDLLEGGPGADVLWGGSGLDLASYQGSDQGVAVDLRDGYARGGHAEGDILHEIEGVVGSAYDDNLMGTDGDNNVLRGGGCLAAGRCWDQARWAVEAYAWRFDGLGRAPWARGAA